MTTPSNPFSVRFSTHENEDGQILHYGDPLAELEALRAFRAFRYGGLDRVLIVDGGDRVDLLQRISAGDLAATREGGSCLLPFTDAKGRIVDAPWVKVLGDMLVATCGSGRRNRLKQWIESYTILEDVSCEAVDDWTVIERAAGAPPNSWSEEDVMEEIDAYLEDGDRPAGELAHAQYCAERLQLRPGLDLDERFNPLEAGLREWVSFDKGCYIGQEVVARLENYDKVRRRPALLHGSNPLARDAELTHAGKRGAHNVQSANRLDADGAYALALLEREIEKGAALHTEDGTEWVVQAAAPVE